MGDRRAGWFVQVGASRDGLDPYLDCARRRGMRAALVETPAYLRWRQALGRRAFDVDVPVETPHDATQVVTALRSAGVEPELVLTGFERYVGSGFAVARAFGVAPYPGVGAEFRPLDKQGQRVAVRGAAPLVAQPRHVTLREPGDEADDALGYPRVVKPVDGGGGLGVFLVDGAAQRTAAMTLLARTRNYGGGSFAGVLAEEFVKGPEVSLQGLAFDGRAHVVSVCEKLVGFEPVDGADGVLGFREIGHVASDGATADHELLLLADRCVAAVGYQEGPFHVDVIRTADGPVLVEMGFRLSGSGLVALVRRATGVDWAELVFRAHLERVPPGPPAGPRRVAGQVALVSPEEVAAAEALATRDADVEVLRVPPPPPERALRPGDLDALASDRLRHTGTLARLVVTGAQLSDVLPALESVVSDRTRV